MLVHRNALGNRLFVVSLPSNLQVELAGKLERLHDLSGGAEVVKAIETLLGVQIDHVATIDIKGFVGMTEALGGLVVKNPHASTTPTGLHFGEGEVTLRGEEAVAFMDDESRIPDRDRVMAERQRSVLRALVLKVLTPETIANPVTFNNVVNQLSKYVTVDKGLTTSEMWSLATSTDVRSSSDLVAAQAPILPAEGLATDQSVSVPDPGRTEELSAALKHDEMGDYSRRYPA
jgi:LCP family protein required for cell wall assembly